MKVKVFFVLLILGTTIVLDCGCGTTDRTYQGIYDRGKPEQQTERAGKVLVHYSISVRGNFTPIQVKIADGFTAYDSLVNPGKYEASVGSMSAAGHVKYHYETISAKPIIGIPYIDGKEQSGIVLGIQTYESDAYVDIGKETSLRFVTSSPNYGGTMMIYKYENGNPVTIATQNFESFSDNGIEGEVR